ncbi:MULTISPECIES: sporulation peptidase YabG [Paraclostridium]|uniref:Sporulation peptidase YabG n=1 Tax=Paraclostridium bifermentans TaxID=1490 RepID=A0AA44DNG9_PARBF|nr:MULTISPECIES: sporulation peptidase YabG [Paraclostridium]MDV8113852.1 sporulation peptidase YabG [Bacillus sp. BAU-SS-2023]MBN8048829.1 sporulation peptidase YabG [Paraclostridium bifermentans]MBZ6007117.1 sporulation peptidase YabG [Paraclostridium bifermentans]MDU0295882.1 sporulation peptidase YabG [Paraclostridium sp. MRS3W1]NME10634.1 sporulation peptidase YabG [Paraclostridium bifermentans]
MKIGDIVVRKSYEKDIIFRIIGFEIDENNQKIAILKGVAFRIIADSGIDDLEKVNFYDMKDTLIDKDVENILHKSIKKTRERNRRLNRAMQKSSNNNSKQAQGQGQNQVQNSYGMPGKVLHIDGDPEYLKICLDVYTKLGIPAVGKAIPESLQYKEVRNLLEQHNPSILVITGHDAIVNSKGNLKDIKNYRNTANFIKTVKEARKYDPSLDSLVIFAGACQSNYEEIIKSGANFASSPSRVMIHALDPLLVVEKIACSRIDKVVPLDEILNHTVTGIKGVGGIETRGKFRLTMPLAIYNGY